MVKYLPRDKSGHPIPAVGLKDGAAHAISFTATAAKNSTAFQPSDNTEYHSRIVSIYATQDCFIKLGTSSVAATTADHFFPAGVYYDISIPFDVTHISAIRSTADGILYVSEKE